jgi:fatty-acyl-CoA synthase
MQMTKGNSKALLDTLEDIKKFEQTPLSERFPLQNTLEVIENNAARYGDDPALEFLLTGKRDEVPVTITFNELADKTRQTANLLTSLGLAEDEALSIMLPTLPQSHPLILGAQCAGIANPLNPLLESEHLAEIMTAANARIIACLAPSPHSDLWQKMLSVLPRLPAIHSVLMIHIPGLTDPDAATDLPDHVEVLDYNLAVSRQPATHLISERQIHSHTLAAFFHTGGTTGRPKIAQLTHGNMAFLGQLAESLNHHLARQTVLCGLPLFHIFGVIILGIGAFSAGNRVVLLTPSGFRNPEVIKNFWHHVARFKAGTVSLVPTVLSALTQIPVGDEDISSLQRLSSGAAPLSPSLAKRVADEIGVAVTNGYGMTETTSLISRAPDTQPPGSSGLRLPYSQIRIAHLDGDKVTRDCGLGETGVILVRGPQVFAGYREAADNKGAWIEGDWFNTGDLGYLEESGYLFLTGRAKDLIIRGGHNIDPETIEEPLNRHPAVLSSIAIGMPDPYAGELPMAFVVLKPSATASADELLAYAQQEIQERAAIPKRIVFLDEIPTTAVGKIFRPAMRQHITATVIQEALLAANISAEVSAKIDSKLGMKVEVRLANPEQQQSAESTLESYPCQVSIA